MDHQVQSEEMATLTTLTAKGAATRARIIEGAAAEIRAVGVASTTLNDICHRTRTSKSQLFHYFPAGKEHLLLAVAQHEADRVLSDQEPFLSDLRSWSAWSAWRDVVVDRYRRQGENCPLSVVTSQLGPASPGAQAVTTQLFRQWQQAIADGIGEMQRQGLIRAGLDAEEASAALLAGLQGGVLILLATGQVAHLEAALDVGIAHLRG
jgi:AcrR family transcriptional regulator